MTFLEFVDEHKLAILITYSIIMIALFAIFGPPEGGWDLYDDWWDD